MTQAPPTSITLLIGEDQFTIDGTTIPVPAGVSVHHASIAHIAASITVPVQVTAIDDGGTHQLRVAPDGSVNAPVVNAPAVEATTPELSAQEQAAAGASAAPVAASPGPGRWG